VIESKSLREIGELFTGLDYAAVAQGDSPNQIHLHSIAVRQLITPNSIRLSRVRSYHIYLKHHKIILGWRMGRDSSVSGEGWRIDNPVRRRRDERRFVMTHSFFGIF
jgi:hypothetical protein